MRGFLMLMMLGPVAACSTASAGAGTFVLTSNVDFRARPVTYSIGGGRVRSEDLDAALDKDCVRGSMAGEPLDLCSTATQPDGTQRWEGSSGDVSIKLVDQGRAFQVSGYVTLAAGRSFDVTQTLRAQQGGAWDELRRHPVLLVIATTATDLHAMRGRRRPL
jgi:hypothetical protein